MATTKKSTTKQSASRRTKTAAAKTARTTKAAATKRAPAKTTKKPATTTRAAKVTPASVVGNAASSLKKWRIINLVLTAILGTVVSLFVVGQSYEVVSGLLVKNTLPAPGTSGFIPAVHHVVDVDIRTAFATIMGVSMLLSIIALIRYRKERYATVLTNRVNGLRWLDIGIMSALLIELAALLSGINDLLTLKLLAGFMLITAALGWISEKRTVQASRPVKSELVIGVVTAVMPWIIIAGYAINTYAYGVVRSPWYVYALYVALIIGFGGYCLNLKRWVRGKVASYEVAERNYLALSLLTKLAVALILIIGLHK
jgi:hypothetical protein